MLKFKPYMYREYSAHVNVDYLVDPFVREVRTRSQSCFSMLRKRYDGWVVVYWCWHQDAEVRTQQKKYIKALIKATDDPNHLVLPGELGVWIIVDCGNSKVSANYTYTFLSFSRIPFEGVGDIIQFKGMHGTLYNMIRLERYDMQFNENHRIFSHVEKKNLPKYKKCKKLSDLFGWTDCPVSLPISESGYKSPTGKYVGISDASWW